MVFNSNELEKCILSNSIKMYKCTTIDYLRVFITFITLTKTKIHPNTNFLLTFNGWNIYIDMRVVSINTMQALFFQANLQFNFIYIFIVPATLGRGAELYRSVVLPTILDILKKNST